MQLAAGVQRYQAVIGTQLLPGLPGQHITIDMPGVYLQALA